MAELKTTAAQLLEGELTPQFALECLCLEPGKLTLVSGPSNTTRSRFALGLMSVLMESPAGIVTPTIWYFNRNWTHHEVMTNLLHFFASRFSQRTSSTRMDFLMWAMEAIQHSGLVYDTASPPIDEVCRRVDAENASQPGRIVVVDGLEHFHPEDSQRKLSRSLPEYLHQLRQLAHATSLPVLTTCPPLQQNDKKAIEDHWIQLSS